MTGITGQDGALLAELLLGKGYTVHGMRRHASSANTARIDHLLDRPPDVAARLHLHYGDLTDAATVLPLVRAVAPDEIYNLGAESHVGVAFEVPVYMADVNALGTVRLLEAVRGLGAEREVRFYQASTAEMFGNATRVPQDETVPLAPRNLYGTAKLFAYWATVNYRELYGIHASNGILFSHEGPTRGEGFVTRKITRTVAAIARGRQCCLTLGNLDARRDWGHARDYVEGMWRVVRHPEPGDYVLATGETHTLREFVELAFAEIGVEIAWEGCGEAERGRDAASGAVRVAVDARYFRPNEVGWLVGDAGKARRVLGWRPQGTFPELVAAMVRADLVAAAGGH